MSREVRYVCHRAANAIITQVDPLRVSTDALQVINQFLDEFVSLLVSSAQSLDLSRIKTAVLQLIASAVGKNAIVEAELQVKSYSESASIDATDYEAYERTRTLADPATLLGPIIDRLRHECVDYCNLAEKNHQNPKNSRRRPSLATTVSSTTTASGTAAAKDNLVISPIVTVYVTAIIEHVAEYILTAIAVTAEHQDTEYIRVKEIYLTLSDDVQVGNMFSKMALRERLEKRASALNYRSSQQQQQQQQYPHHHYQQHENVLPSPAPSPVTSSRKQSNVHIRDSSTDPYMNIGFADDEELDYSQPSSPLPNGKIPSMYSMTTPPQQQHQQHARPMSIMSTSTSTNTISSTTSSSSKKGFRFFKKRDSVATTESYNGPQSPVRQTHQRNSISQQQQQRQSKTPVSVSVYHSDSPAINFEDLIRSGDTVRLSLTPSRLKSIEIMKDHSAIEKSASSSSSVRSADSDSFIAAKQLPRPPSKQQQQQQPPLPSSPPSSSPPPIQSASLDHTTTTARRAATSSQPLTQTPRHSNQSLHKNPSLDEPVTPFENPRSAPKPPALKSIVAPGNSNNNRTSFNVESDHPIPSPRQQRQQPRKPFKENPTMERPSSMVAKRASMINTRPTSYHENFALQYATTEGTTPDGILVVAAPPHHLQTSTSSSSLSSSSSSNGAVREKVLKFERADQHGAATQTPKAVYLDAGVQTEPELPRLVVTAEEDGVSERGIVVGDEEWFVPDEDWEEDEHEQEHTIVEWLLGE
ncbi:hypothetical protein BDB00DRAFT_856882 [Zychaea mexicana]|uniref:uncharacterized protein n=1 Tax=Zychaea mexicana TaxID=64656 RepID=UPI0022FE076E|nr:uncharacterized protein BDB00DRAFT_856882 [Zychaea mexicana]KAI9482625.1 hypothetical protein BDB00DRAFT_856882 [Zychaea mexicana]